MEQLVSGYLAWLGNRTFNQIFLGHSNVFAMYLQQGHYVQVNTITKLIQAGRVARSSRAALPRFINSFWNEVLTRRAPHPRAPLPLSLHPPPLI